MRLRNNPNAKDILEKSKYIINEKKTRYFENDRPVHLEIGMGKGDFIIGMAKKYPNINFIGVEKFDTVLVKALSKLENSSLDNVLFISLDANELLDYFPAHTIGCIYLNFSDPWPKKRHYKRRLTYSGFLKLYQKLLVKDGLIKQKTDDRSLFESSLISYNQFKMNFEYLSLDLHNSERAKENVMSEYERRFSVNGVIYAVDVSFRKGDK